MGSQECRPPTLNKRSRKWKPKGKNKDEPLTLTIRKNFTFQTMSGNQGDEQRPSRSTHWRSVTPWTNGSSFFWDYATTLSYGLRISKRGIQTAKTLFCPLLKKEFMWSLCKRPMWVRWQRQACLTCVSGLDGNWFNVPSPPHRQSNRAGVATMCQKKL